MDELIIRKAALKDLTKLLEFEQALINAERPFDVSIKDGEIHYYDIAQMIVASDVEVAVAELNDEIVGAGYARIEAAKPYLKHQRHAYLGFMYVHPNHRGKGINSKIVEALKQWALAQNITELVLDVYHDNLAAVKAYEKAGFTKHLLQMRMEIK